MYNEVENKKLHIKNTTLGEVFQLIPHLRADDKKELLAGGNRPSIGLLKSYFASFICKTVLEGNKVIGIYGASTKLLPEGYCSIWFLGADESENYPITFVKEGKRFIKQMSEKYHICNCVYSGNTKHIEYLKRLGLTVREDKPTYIKKGIFYPFYKIREV